MGALQEFTRFLDFLAGVEGFFVCCFSGFSRECTYIVDIGASAVDDINPALP